MHWFEPVFAIALAVLFALFLIVVIGRRPVGTEPISAFLFLLLIFFPILWAGTIWLTPAGPMYFGTALLPTILLGILLLLLFAILTEPPPDVVSPSDMETLEAKETATAFGLLFWLLLVLAVASIIFGYT